MTITVDDPVDGGTADVDVSNDNSISVAGMAEQNNLGPSQVCVKIYSASTPISSIPATPPGDALCESTIGIAFSVAAVPDAACSADPGTENLLVIWAEFGGSYERSVTSFFGICI